MWVRVVAFSAIGESRLLRVEVIKDDMDIEISDQYQKNTADHWSRSVREPISRNVPSPNDSVSITNERICKRHGLYNHNT